MTPLEITLASLGWFFAGALIVDRLALKEECRKEKIRRIEQMCRNSLRLYDPGKASR